MEPRAGERLHEHSAWGSVLPLAVTDQCSLPGQLLALRQRILGCGRRNRPGLQGRALRSPFPPRLQSPGIKRGGRKPHQCERKEGGYF